MWQKEVVLNNKSINDWLFKCQGVESIGSVKNVSVSVTVVE